MFFDSVRWTALLTLLVTFGAAQEEEGMSTFVFYVDILVVFYNSSKASSIDIYNVLHRIQKICCRAFMGKRINIYMYIY